MPDLITTRALSLIVHGDSKAGKSTIITTMPGPILLIDAESASRFMPGRKVRWNPVMEAPPVDDGTWDIAVVKVESYLHMVRAYEWLNSGQHPFRSVGVDSITEIQVKLKEQVTGDSTGAGMDMRRWGEVLAHMEDLMRKLRDLTEHPTHPIEAIVITAMTTFQDGKWRPFMQGQSSKKAPYLFDVIGYVYVELVYDNNNPAAPPQEVHRMLTGFDPNIIAGERVGGKIPRVIDNVRVTDMLDQVFGPAPAEGAPVPTDPNNTQPTNQL